MTKFYVDQDGKYLGGFDGGVVITLDENRKPIETPVEPVVPVGAIQVPIAPPYGSDTWNGSTWVANPLRLAEEARKASIKTDPVRVELLNKLKTATNMQIENYVNNRVTNISTAKDLFIDILKLIALDYRNGS